MKKISTLLFLFVGLFLSSHLSAQINAIDDTFSVIYGSTVVTAGNVLTNDTLNAAAITPGAVTITQLSSTNAGISLSGSNVVVAAGTPKGTYTLTYKICSVANSALCDTATVTIHTELIANPDYFTVNCFNGYIGNVLGSGTNLNYVDTLNGVPAILQTYFTQPGNVEHPADVTLSVLSGYPGMIDVFSNGDVVALQPLPAGHFVIVYELREIAHSDNASIGYINIDVMPPFIYVGDDYFPAVDNTIGGLAGNIFSNDFIDCMGQLNQFNSVASIPNIPEGFTLDPDGSLYVAQGTTPGSYAINYLVTDTLGALFGTATIYVQVLGTSALVANYDDFGAPNYANTTTASVLNNDTLDGLPINASQILLTPLNTPAGFTLNSNGTIIIGASVPEGTYTVPYRICDAANTSSCYVNYAYVVVLKNRIVGTIRYDYDDNGCSVTDPLLLDIGVKNTNGPTTYSSATRRYSWEYYLIGDSGTNTISVTGIPNYFTVTPATQVFNLSTPGTVTATDFCVSANSNVDDLEIVLIPLFNVVPGLPALYDISYRNNGTTMLDGQITFHFDDTKMAFINSNPNPDSTTLNSVTYNYVSLRPFESRTIWNLRLQVETPPTVDAGQVIPFSGNITPAAADYTPANNVSTINQTVVNSQDPNDIIVHEGASLTLAEAQQGYLHYTIRFQNVGTSDAINIKVLNDLDPKLDWTTFKLVRASHLCRIKNTNNHNEFLFENINLPGTSQEELSHGYISYKIKPISGIAVGDIIRNTANIYFDFNAPVATNEASTTIVNNLAVADFALSKLVCFPNPAKNKLNISNDYPIDSVQILSVLGQEVFNKKINDLQTSLDISTLPTGLYFVKVRTQGLEKIVKINKE